MQHDVVTICNALVDVLVEISEEEFAELKIERGIMHLVDHERQAWLLSRFKNHDQIVELGGSGMNTTRALAALGKKCAFFGSVGEDDFQRRITGRMRELGIESRLTSTEHPTGSCAVLITPDGERTMNTFLGASLHYHHEVLPIDAIQSARLLHVTGYQWSTEHQKKAVKQALSVAKEAGAKISFDVADPFVVRLFRDDFIATIAEYADIVFANAQEAEDLYGSTPEEAAAKIAKTGATAVVKLGARGALVADARGSTAVAAVPTTVIDTTGAGDMFAAGFLFGWLNERSHAVCGQMAAVLASDVISRIGARLSDGVYARVRELNKA